jgi:hypothetical protein
MDRVFTGDYSGSVCAIERTTATLCKGLSHAIHTSTPSENPAMKVWGKLETV